MSVSSQDIANQALMLIGGNQPLVTGGAPTFDTSTAGKALAQLYTPCVQTVGRQFAWDMARSTIALALSGNVAPQGWAFEYLYPSNGIEVWQLLPPVLTDPNNPLPLNWNVGNALVTAVQKKVIWANIAGALATYNNNPTEAVWDPGFREAVVRLLASELGMAISGKPDSAQLYLESGAAFESGAEQRPD
jgi:hypothetical protein